MLADPTIRGRPGDAARHVRRARLGLQIAVHNASDREIDAAFATFVERQARRAHRRPEPTFQRHRDQLVALAARHKVPAI